MKERTIRRFLEFGVATLIVSITVGSCSYYGYGEHMINEACREACKEPKPYSRQLQKTIACSYSSFHEAKAICLMDGDHAIIIKVSR